MRQPDTTTLVDRHATERCHEFSRAMVAGDADALESLLAPDFTYTHANAHVEPRDELIPSIRGGRKNARMDFEDMTVRAYPGVAIVNGRAHLRVGPADKPIEFSSSFSAVWVDVAGSPRLVVYHSTRLPNA